MQMQEVLRQHQKQSQIYYGTLCKDIIGGKLRLPKKCAYTLRLLTEPVRSTSCQKLDCVYDLSTIQNLIEVSGANFKCIRCEQPIGFDNLFLDSYIAKSLLLTKKPVFMNQQLKLVFKDNLGQDQEFKEELQLMDLQILAEMEKRIAEVLKLYLVLNLVKQRGETLSFLKSLNFDEQINNQLETLQKTMDGRIQHIISPER